MPQVKPLSLFLALSVFCAAPAFAQNAPRTSVTAGPDPRGYVAAAVGAVTGPPTNGSFSVEYGEDLSRHVQAYATLAYLENVMPQQIQDDLVTIAARLAAQTATPWELRGRDRGIAFTAGAKYMFGGSGVRPYLGGGAGVINLRRSITDVRLGEVATAIYNDYSVGDSDLSRSPDGVMRPLAEALAGVSVPAGPTVIDVGYRYRRVLHLNNGLQVSQVSVGIGYRF
jgi:opacity protein-like surface antigen